MSASPLHDICCARMPAAALPVLATLRHVRGVRVLAAGPETWLYWPEGQEETLRQVLAAPGVELYRRREGHWYRHGHVLPAFHIPEEHGSQPLGHVLTPAPVRPVEAAARPTRPVELRLVQDGLPRAATGLLADVREVARWAEAAPTAALQAVAAARCGTRVLLRGRSLPALPGGERFWGDRVLLPLGRRAEPNLPESALREVLRLAGEEWACFTASGIEVVPAGALEPLTRAGVRLALKAG